MARQSKLSNEQFNEFLRDRAGGMRLVDCAAKYGLTQSRLSQIYRKWEAAQTIRDAVELVEVEREPVSEVEGDPSEPGHPYNPRSDYSV